MLIRNHFRLKSKSEHRDDRIRAQMQSLGHLLYLMDAARIKRYCGTPQEHALAVLNLRLYVDDLKKSGLWNGSIFQTPERRTHDKLRDIQAI